MEVTGFNKDGSISITLNGVSMTVPDDMGNRHRQMIAEWEGEGNTIPPYEDPGQPVPHTVTRWQLIEGLATVGWITEQEALDAASVGAMPAAVEAVISSLPEEDQFKAKMKWINFQNALRDDPLVAALANAQGKTEDEVDEFFRLCASLGV